MNTNQATCAVIEALDALGIPYMLVGSFSSNVYGVSRATKDADFVVQCRGGDIAAVVKHVGPPFRLDPQIMFETVTGTTRYVVSVEGLAFRIELFRLSDDPHDRLLEFPDLVPRTFQRGKEAVRPSGVRFRELARARVVARRGH
jgi:hypothetical protein